MDSVKYTELYHKYIGIAKRVALDVAKAYGRRDELLEEASSALGHVLVDRWERIELEGRNKAACVANYVRWWMLDYVRKLCKRQPTTITTNIPCRKSRVFMQSDVPAHLQSIVSIILDSPEEFECRPSVVRWQSTPVYRFLVKAGMNESEAIRVQSELEDYFKDILVA